MKHYFDLELLINDILVFLYKKCTTTITNAVIVKLSFLRRISIRNWQRVDRGGCTESSAWLWIPFSD